MASCTESERALLNGLLTDKAGVSSLVEEWRLSQIPQSVRDELVLLERCAKAYMSRRNALYNILSESYGVKFCWHKDSPAGKWFDAIEQEGRQPAAELPQSPELHTPRNNLKQAIKDEIDASLQTYEDNELAFFKRSAHD